MKVHRIRNRALVLCLAMLMTAACSKTDNSDLNYKTAINNHFKAFPTCIWSEAKKFPVQAATSDDAKTEGYDALTQEGLLTRTTAEKKVLIIASKQVNNYDLSDKGRTSWTPDSSQPGYGNFCYGSREVTSIDNSTVGTNGAGADRRCQLSLQDCECSRMGEFPGDEDGVSQHCNGAGVESFGHREPGDDRRSLGVCEITELVLRVPRPSSLRRGF